MCIFYCACSFAFAGGVLSLAGAAGVCAAFHGEFHLSVRRGMDHGAAEHAVDRLSHLQVCNKQCVFYLILVIGECDNFTQLFIFSYQVH